MIMMGRWAMFVSTALALHPCIAMVHGQVGITSSPPTAPTYPLGSHNDSGLAESMTFVSAGREHEAPLTAIGMVGMSVSMVLLATVLLLQMLGASVNGRPAPLQKRALRHMILSYLIAVGMTFASMMHTDNDATCRAIGWLLHFWLLSAFCWMGVEGNILYHMFVTVFTNGQRTETMQLARYALFAYGFPFVLVVLLAGLRPESYGRQNQAMCWLAGGDGGGAVWAFVGPAACVGVVNLIVLGHILYHLSMEDTDGRSHKRFRASISAAFSTIMGGVWILAILMLGAKGEALVVMMYIFTILNGFCGVWIFVFHGGRDGHLWHRAFQRVRHGVQILSGQSPTKTMGGAGTVRGNMTLKHRQTMSTFAGKASMWMQPLRRSLARLTMSKGSITVEGGVDIDSYLPTTSAARDTYAAPPLDPRSSPSSSPPPQAMRTVARKMTLVDNVRVPDVPQRSTTDTSLKEKSVVVAATSPGRGASVTGHAPADGTHGTTELAEDCPGTTTAVEESPTRDRDDDRHVSQAGPDTGRSHCLDI
eukprot:m.58290 g.58290  ORF g.58290 m.58290 type:complete len:534 (-) comp7818_c0_seq1:48-1649(-)